MDPGFPLYPEQREARVVVPNFPSSCHHRQNPQHWGEIHLFTRSNWVGEIDTGSNIYSPTD